MSQELENIQILEPEGDLPVAQIQGALSDPAITERGEVELDAFQSVVSVTFATPKINSTYRFEYLYVDAFGQTNPGAINPVAQLQTAYGFTVDLAAVPEIAGYILRWRVVVVSSELLTQIDAPESLRVQIPYQVPDFPIPPGGGGIGEMTVTFVNPRSVTTYGFSELRVENLIDAPETQTPIQVQVYEKNLTDFKVAFTPIPFNAHYFLVVRTP